MADILETGTFAQGFSAGYAMGVAVGALAEACRNKQHDYSDIVPRSYFDHMYKMAAMLNYSLVEVETVPTKPEAPDMVRVEIRRIKDGEGNATVNLKPMPRVGSKLTI